MKTYSAKSGDVQRKWYVIDAADQVVGRVAVKAAELLRGPGEVGGRGEELLADQRVVAGGDEERQLGIRVGAGDLNGTRRGADLRQQALAHPFDLNSFLAPSTPNLHVRNCNPHSNSRTLSRLANHLKINIRIIPRITPQTVDAIVADVLNKHRGEAVLIVGNGSGNLRALHQRLGGEGDGPYQYGDLFIYKIPKEGPVQVVKSRF